MLPSADLFTDHQLLCSTVVSSWKVEDSSAESKKPRMFTIQQEQIITDNDIYILSANLLGKFADWKQKIGNSFYFEIFILSVHPDPI
jgi:hypothetical protein